MISCDIVRDLLPLYCDNVCSEASSEAVRQHLEECEACRAVFEEMSAALAGENTETDVEAPVRRSMQALKKRFRWKRLITALIAVGCVAGLLCGAGYFVFVRETPVTCSKDMFSVEQRDDGTVEVMRQGNRFPPHSKLIMTICKENELFRDGADRDIYCFYYTTTVWTNWMRTPSDNRKLVHDCTLRWKPDPNREAWPGLAPEEVVDAIYYMPNDFNQKYPFGKLTPSSLSDAVLLWEKTK